MDYTKVCNRQLKKSNKHTGFDRHFFFLLCPKQGIVGGYYYIIFSLEQQLLLELFLPPCFLLNIFIFQRIFLVIACWHLPILSSIIMSSCSRILCSPSKLNCFSEHMIPSPFVGFFRRVLGAWL